MKKNIIFVLSILVAFLMGCLSTYIMMTKQQMDNLLQAKQIPQKPLNHNNDNLLNSQTISKQTDDTKLSELLANIPPTDKQDGTQQQDKQGVSIHDYSETQAKAMIDSMPDYVLEQYIDKFMAKNTSDVITNKRRFAERAVEELYKSNDNQPLVGEVKLSLSKQMPVTSMDTSHIQKNAKIYAHLDTHGKVANSPYVFVKWVNNETGQVLLFEKKDIVADSQQNWVSFRPYDGWQTGSYDIRFYQFSSELQPVAQLTYHIYQVMDSN